MQHRHRRHSHWFTLGGRGWLCGLGAIGACITACTSIPPRAPHTDPKAAKAELVDGNLRYLDGGMHAHTWQAERVIETGEFGQSPSIGVLTCADSRTPPELIFDQGVGDLFVVRIAGNFVDDGAVGTFEYGVAALGVHTIVVLGHTKCGAVAATCAGGELPGKMNVFTAAIRPAVVAGATPAEAEVANVRWQMKQVLERSDTLRQAKAAGTLVVLGAMYDVQTGEVRFLD